LFLSRWALSGSFGRRCFPVPRSFWLTGPPCRKRLRRNPWVDRLAKEHYSDAFSPDPRVEWRESKEDPFDRPAILEADVPKPYQYGIVGHAPPSLLDDASARQTSPFPSPLPSPGALGPGGPPPPRHSPASSTASDQPLLGGVYTPPHSPPSRMRSPPVPLLASPPGSRSPVSLVDPPAKVDEDPRAEASPDLPPVPARRSTSDSRVSGTGTLRDVTIGTPSSSALRMPLHLTLANWNPVTDGTLVDIDSVVGAESPAVESPTTQGVAPTSTNAETRPPNLLDDSVLHL
jgi:hypothetical protein